MTRLLVIGASGKAGSATVRAALALQIPTLAFLRTPSKLASDLKVDSLQVVQGDATSSETIRSALSSSGPISAVVLAAPYASMRKRGATDFEKIMQNVLTQVKLEQDSTGRKIKVWVMAGAAMLEHPDYRDRILSSFFPFSFFPEYIYALEWLRENCTDVDWTILCPAKIEEGAPVGPYFESIETMPQYGPPFALLRWIPGWYAINIFYNWMTGPVTFQTLGLYMVDHLEPDGRLKGRRVAVLEDPKATK